MVHLTMLESTPRREGAPRRLRQILLRHFAQVKGRMLLAALCTVSVTATELLQPWPLKIILDYGVLRHPLPDSLGFLRDLVGTDYVALVAGASGVILLIALVGALLAYFQIFITTSLGYTMVYTLRRELFAHLQRLSLSFHNRAKSGDLLMKVAGDTDTLKNVVAEAVLKFSSQLLTVIGMFVILLLLDWRIGLIAMATLPFLAYTLFHLYRRTKRSVKAQKRHEGEVASRISEVLAAVPMVQAFAREAYEEERLEAVTAATMRESIRVARLKAAATRSSEMITAAGTATAVLFGALQVLEGTMLPGDLILVVAYLSKLYNPIKGMAKLSNQLSTATASAERISDVLDLEPEIQDRPDAVEAGPLAGQIVFDNVSFDYGDEKPVLQHISFRVSPGQRLALIGPSGAGKSTIVSLIMRLYEPRAGVILIDGVDIQQYRRESLRRRIGLVLQDSLLFGATIRENIGYGKPEARLEEIVAAAEAANADEFIRNLDDGYDTVIGERGVTLSGGQRQRIAIARALIRDAPMLILDEPMTGLDVESEVKVREALDHLIAGKTCIMITHDLPSVADADLVLVLDEGRITARGRHADLLAASHRYRRLYELEMRPAIDISA